MLYRAYSPLVEVNGETVLSVVDGMGAYKTKALQILKDNGIDNPRPGQWYSQQNWLNAFKTIAQSIGTSTLLQIGKSIPENAKFPPEIDNIHKALAAIDVAYHMNHRNGEIGNYKYEKINDKSVKIICKNPYPTDFDKGIIESMAKKFKPQGTLFVKVTVDATQPQRNQGGESDTYIITW
jgi:hypothetical protein